MDHISPTILRALVLIQKYGNVTKSAVELGVSQPAISRGITQLEKTLGLSLMRRGSRPLELTREGQILVDYALSNDLLLKQVSDQLAAARNVDDGLVRIGSFGASASTRLLPAMLDSFKAYYPNVNVQIHEYSDANILNALRGSHIDFAVMVEPDLNEVETLPISSNRKCLDLNEVETLPIATDRLVALVGKDSLHSSFDTLMAKDFLETPFIMTKGGSETLVRQWFQESDCAVNVSHSVLQISSILELVRSGMGYSIIAEMALPISFERVAVIPLAPNAPRRICLSRNASNFHSNAAKTFWEFQYQNL